MVKSIKISKKNCELFGICDADNFELANFDKETNIISFKIIKK